MKIAFCKKQKCRDESSDGIEEGVTFVQKNGL